MSVNKDYYNTILCQTFSPCGKFLVTGDIQGIVSVFNLEKIINPPDEEDPKYRKPKWKFESKTYQVCSLASTDKFLIIGGLGEIIGWDWQKVLTGEHSPKTPTIAWTIQIPTKQDDIIAKTDVNVLKVDPASNYLYAGCGDNNVYVFNLEYGKLVKTMEGHTDFIHWLQIQNSQIVTCGEDGYVKLWDIRDKKSHNEIIPFKNDKLSRPNLGKWVGCVALNDDWLLCGGGTRLSLWHLRSLDVATIYSIEDNGIHVCQFYEDRIMAGGTSPQFYQLSFNGEIYAEIPSSSTSIFSIGVQDDPKILCLAGSSPKVDICTNFNYRDQILSLY